jgi:hypothetical protein
MHKLDDKITGNPQLPLTERQVTGNGAINLGLRSIPIWPQNQNIESLCDPTVRRTLFADIQEYHPRLISKILEFEEHQRMRKRHVRGAGGARIHHLEKWASAEAELINARAKMLFQHVLESKEAVVDLCWAGVYRAGDYCMPHSHVRTVASVVYCLDPGDEDLGDPQGGRFSFVDPRLATCCPDQKECLTAPFSPEMTAGTMIIFPSQLVHTVNPYNGMRPRITLSWNINKQVLPVAEERSAIE